MKRKSALWLISLMLGLSSSASGQSAVFTYQGRLTRPAQFAICPQGEVMRLYMTLLLLSLILGITPTALAQSTAFTYQGKLTDASLPANGNYDFQFKLFDAASGGSQQGVTLVFGNLAVSAGIFTVQLDFGQCASCFDGSARFLDIAVKPTGAASFTTLSPRQPVTSTPYAIKTQNLTLNGPFTNAGGTTFPALNTFAGAGAGQNTTPDVSMSILSGKLNSFFGADAGQANVAERVEPMLLKTTGNNNSFFGAFAGFLNTGISNAFFGYLSGSNNIAGGGNSFVGSNADFLFSNATGNSNTLLGYSSKVSANISNATAIGAQADVTQSNSLVLSGITGVNNGTSVNVGIGTPAPSFKLHVIDSLATGLRVQTNTSGGTVASFGANGDFQIDAPGINSGRFVVKESGNVGINNSTPSHLLEVKGLGSDFGGFGDLLVTGTGTIGAALTLNSTGISGRSYTLISTASDAGAEAGKFGIFDIAANSYRMVIDRDGNVGIGTRFPSVPLDVEGNGFFSGHVHVGTNSSDFLEVVGPVRLFSLGSAGSLHLCINSSSEISTCSSSLRYKTNLTPFTGGLEVINRLHPITFTWKQDGTRDIGFGAEDVAKVEPLFTFNNDRGEIEGLKYDRMSVLFVNAIKEQQSQIVALPEQLRYQRQYDSRLENQLTTQHDQIEALKKLVCLDHPTAGLQVI